MSNKQSKADLYFSDIDKWENGELGDSEEFDRPSTMAKELKKLLNGVEDSSDDCVKPKMQLISMRLPTTLITDLKNIGEIENLGYQTLAREVLTRFVEAESRKKLNELLSQYRKLEKEVKFLKANERENENDHNEEKLA
ncbi:hypothetical protein ACTXKB_14025 [Psychrobacter aquimaris]|uniref:hypothetical protein n=1 Tax=Psychrobacter aquimaris TaxID=292733 RepID=UPI003FD4A5A3